ncbi:MBL fold metallo-hydrolase RNA specificity domain-containing protein, partial [Oleiphilus sp. HI0066]|uniref:MBL fold metallo-hydrolase RNA specificity domain-containing protein n=3 Tax=Oleiphilus TaxID=141450 RepID=UPI0026F41C5D
RLARNQFRDLELEEGDTVIFSSIVIPGNEEHIHRLIEQLEQKKISVITKYNTSRTIHASGHPSEQDLLDLYGWVQPSLVIPTHGEQLHLAANAKVAKQAKVPRQMTGFNGDLFELVGAKRV